MSVSVPTVEEYNNFVVKVGDALRVTNDRLDRIDAGMLEVNERLYDIEVELEEIHPLQPVKIPGDPGPGKLYYGANGNDAINLEKEIGRTVTLHRTFQATGTMKDAQFLVTSVRADMAAGRYPVASMKRSGTTWKTMAESDNGWDVIRFVATELGKLAKPVAFCVDHEPEDDYEDRLAGRGNSHATSPADWVAMQEKLIRVVGDIAPNVLVVPILMGATVHGFNKRVADDWHVPSALVMGVDVYKMEPTQMFSKIIETAKRWDQRVLVCEYGWLAEQTQAEYLAKAYDIALKNNFMGLCYFNRVGPRGDWSLLRAGMTEFDRLLQRPETHRPLPQS